MEEIKRIKRELKYKGAILDFYTDTVMFSDNTTAEWDFVSHRMGAACVLPVTDDGKAIMVRQYRNAIDRMTLEVPAGKRDSLDEDTKLTCIRELKEETGYEADNIEMLVSLKSTVAFCDEFIDVYLATGLKKVSEQNLDEGEEIEVEYIPVDDLKQMCFDGTIQDAKTVAAIMAYCVKYNK